MKSVVLKSIVAITVLLSGNMSTYAETAPNPILDTEITRSLEKRLISDEGVSSHLIDITTDQGIVTLTGSIDNYLAHERTEKIARTLKGVRAVVNRLTVRPIERGDTEILNDVKEALLQDPASDSYEVAVEVENGVVTLSGNVDSWAEKDLTEKIARGIRGVKSLKSDITINYGSERADSEIRADIERRLDWDVWVDDRLISVEVSDGEVKLSGTVGSSQEHTDATIDAWVRGVRSVDASDLDVKWWAREKMQRQKKSTDKSDEEIAGAVGDAFLYDPRVYSFNPDVEVQDGVVTITGSVDNLKAKWAAHDDAKNTVGVFRVENYLKVRPTIPITDQKIANEIRQSLLRDPHVERFQVDVVVRNGKAYLYGTVDSEFERRQAADVTSRVKGVVDIANYLDVSQLHWPVTDKDLKAAIENQLFWSPYVNSDNLTVAVEDGNATLKGKVEDWSAWHAATRNAYEGGAKHVFNMATIK